MSVNGGENPVSLCVLIDGKFLKISVRIAEIPP